MKTFWTSWDDFHRAGPVTTLTAEPEIWPLLRGMPWAQLLAWQRWQRCPQIIVVVFFDFQYWLET
jgi:hypothetical protein